MPDLTGPQLDALRVLAKFPDQRIAGWKRKSQVEPRPMVNMRAAGALSRLRLARTHIPDSIFWSPYTHDSKYTITDAGIRQLESEE